MPVIIKEFNTKEKLEVDSKLLKMAEKMDAYVVTNDYNLNKVAEVKGVKVLNINELANAVKPMLLPGEEMEDPHSGDELGDDGGQRGSHNTHVQADDEDDVQDNIGKAAGNQEVQRSF